MRGDRLEVDVTFNGRGYVASAPELRWAVMALSLGGLRRKIEALMPLTMLAPSRVSFRGSTGFTATAAARFSTFPC